MVNFSRPWSIIPWIFRSIAFENWVLPKWGHFEWDCCMPSEIHENTVSGLLIASRRRS
jgi:hypothetical protein